MLSNAEQIDYNAQLLMRLMEDLATIPLNQKVVQIVQSVPSPGFPPNAPELPSQVQQKRHFKQRQYTAMGDPAHKLELKQALLRRIQDPEIKAQFKAEIKALQNQINEKKGD